MEVKVKARLIKAVEIEQNTENMRRELTLLQSPECPEMQATDPYTPLIFPCSEYSDLLKSLNTHLYKLQL